MQPVYKLEPKLIDDFEEELMYSEEELYLLHDPITTEAERIKENLDVTYAPADLEKIVAGCNEISSEEQKQLLSCYKNLNHYLIEL